MLSKTHCKPLPTGFQRITTQQEPCDCPRRPCQACKHQINAQHACARPPQIIRRRSSQHTPAKVWRKRSKMCAHRIGACIGGVQLVQQHVQRRLLLARLVGVARVRGQLGVEAAGVVQVGGGAGGGVQPGSCPGQLVDEAGGGVQNLRGENGLGLGLRLNKRVAQPPRPARR